MNGEDYDALWLYDPPAALYGEPDFSKYMIDVPMEREPPSKGLKDLYARYALGGLMAPSSGNNNIPLSSKPKTKPRTKEKPQMNTIQEDQRMIDAAVREAIAKPRREAEIAKRLAAVEALGVEDAHEIGTVLRFKRKESGQLVSYVSFKTDKDVWQTTGGKQFESYVCSRSWEGLTEFLTTGPVLAEDIEVSSTWTPVL